MKQAQNNQEANNNPIKKIILHFDLFKTITLFDIVANQSKEDLLMEILIKLAWGRMDEKNPEVWKLGHNLFTLQPPQQGMLSYESYLDDKYKLLTEEEEPDEDNRNNQNNLKLEERKNCIQNFVKQGGTGYKLKADLDRLLKHISLPKIALNELNISNLGMTEEEYQNMGEQEVHPLLRQFKDGKYFILPNFYKTMINLKKQKKEYALIFRSFYEDLDLLVEEFNRFCKGEHPCYNGRNNLPMARFDGSKSTKNFIIDKPHQVVIHRFGNELDDISGVFGTLGRKEKVQKLEDAYEKEIEEENCVIEEGGGNIQLRIMELLKESCAIAIKDDLHYWQTNEQKTEASKLLLIDQFDYSTLQIFFNDSIESVEEGVEQIQKQSEVCVYDYVLNQKLPIKRAINQYIVKVDIFSLLKDPDYFIKQIDICEKNHLQEIEKFERGGLDENQLEAQKKSAWELLQASSDSDYLRQTVMPLLHPALTLLDIERPNDPISFIAFYLLKNKYKMKLPQKPIQEKVEENEEQQNELIKEQEEELEKIEAQEKAEKQQPQQKDTAKTKKK